MGSGVLLPVLPSDANPVAGLPHIPDFDWEPLRRLATGAVPHNELSALIEKVVLNVEPADIVKCLQKNDAQTFIDVIDQVFGVSSSSFSGCVANPRLVRHWTTSTSRCESATSV